MVMYRLRPLITVSFILAIIVSSTIVVANNINHIYKSGKEINGFQLSLNNVPINGYEKSFEGMKLEYLGFIHYTYTEITGEHKKTNYTDTTFDFYLTINNIDKDLVTYSGEVRIERLYSDNPSDKEYVEKLANMYNFDSLTKQLGYPVISITDYIEGFLDDSDLHVEKWDSEANLAELSTTDYTTVTASYEFNISGKIDISGAKNAYFVIRGYADYHDYLSIPIDFYVETTVTAETETQKIIIQQEISLSLKSEYLKNMLDKSNTASEFYSIGRKVGTIRLTAKNAEMQKEKANDYHLVLTVNGEGLGFIGIELIRPSTIEKILVDNVEQEYITLFKGAEKEIIILPISLSAHTVEIYFKGAPLQEEKTTTTTTTTEQETSIQKTTRQIEKPLTETTTISKENDILLYIIAGGFTILIILMIIILIVVLVFRRK